VGPKTDLPRRKNDLGESGTFPPTASLRESKSEVRLTKTEKQDLARVYKKKGGRVFLLGKKRGLPGSGKNAKSSKKILKGSSGRK